MINLVLQCLIAGHKEIGPSLYETDLLCPKVGIVSVRHGRTTIESNTRSFDTKPSVSEYNGLTL